MPPFLLAHVPMTQEAVIMNSVQHGPGLSMWFTRQPRLFCADAECYHSAVFAQDLPRLKQWGNHGFPGRRIFDKNLHVTYGGLEFRPHQAGVIWPMPEQ